jgi:hypothetical protein
MNFFLGQCNSLYYGFLDVNLLLYTWRISPLLIDSDIIAMVIFGK